MELRRWLCAAAVLICDHAVTASAQGCRPEGCNMPSAAYTGAGLVTTMPVNRLHIVVTTSASGTWTVTFPPSFATTLGGAPKCFAQPVSTASVLGSGMYFGAMSAPTSTSVSGLVAYPAAAVVGSLALVAAPAGVSVDVLCVAP